MDLEEYECDGNGCYNTVLENELESHTCVEHGTPLCDDCKQICNWCEEVYCDDDGRYVGEQWKCQNCD